MKGTIRNREDNFQTERFICAHTIMLGLKGTPAFYTNTLLGTKIDYDHMENLQAKFTISQPTRSPSPPKKDLPEQWRRAGADLISEKNFRLDTELVLASYQSMWIKRI